jgi:para-nitrobenzyl esterase
LALLLFAVTCAAITATRIVNTTLGPVAGFDEGPVSIFRNIPYGEDTAKTRFKPPNPAKPWTELKSCVDRGNIALQPFNVTIPGQSQSEDCLNLNVFASQNDEGMRPVLVWLHPGDYDHDSGNNVKYDGRDLAVKRNAIVITINHRLGGFGFLYLGNTGKEYEQGNAGLLDIVLALKWVQDNINNFGGDKDKVTLFGQGGGAAKISTLMAMPAAKGLFRSVWLMSGHQITGRTKLHAQQTADEILAQVVGSSREEKLKNLDTMPTEQLQKLFAGIGTRWTPLIDGTTLLRDPFSPNAPEESRSVSMMMSSTYDETRSTLGKDHPQLFNLQWDQVPVQLDIFASNFLGGLNTTTLTAQYREQDPDSSPSDVFFHITTTAMFWHPMLIQAEARARQTGAAPIWIYYFDWRSPAQGGKWGAGHGYDLPFVFAEQESFPETAGWPQTYELMEWLSRALVFFARDGKPELQRVENIKEWPTYTIPSRQSVLFDNTYVMLRKDDRAWERKLFENVTYVQPGT